MVVDSIEITLINGEIKSYEFKDVDFVEEGLQITFKYIVTRNLKKILIEESIPHASVLFIKRIGHEKDEK